MALVNVFKVLVILLLVGWLGLYGAEYLGSRQFENKHQDLLEAMEFGEGHEKGKNNLRPDMACLPPVVSQYLEKAVPRKQTKGELTRVWQKGRIRLTEDSSWSDFTASEHITFSNRQMVWAAEVQLFPMTRLYILTSNLKDSARVDSWLWGLLKASEKKGQVIRAYLMLRWLAEAVWHPEDLLPGPGLKWQQEVKKIGRAKAARVILSQGEIKVSGTFLFASDKGAPFFFMADPGPFSELRTHRFFCRYFDWRREHGALIPFRMEQGVRHGVSDDTRLQIELLRMQKR